MEEKLKILLLEDSEDDAGLLARILKQDGMAFTIKRVDSRDEFTKAMDTLKPDVILSDHALPEFNSLEAFKLFQAKQLSIPFILVTGTVSEEFAVNVLKQGVDDYILKRNLSRLSTSITNSLSKHKAKRDKKLAEEELKRQYEELVKINHELDNFVYSISHNLRAPLLSVLGLLNLFKTECAPGEKETQYLELMTRSINSLDKTLKDILDYSQNSRNEIEHTSIQLKEILDECFKTFFHIKGVDRVHREVSVQEKVPFFSDQYRVTMIIRNLISNALYYHDPDKDKPVLEVEAVVDATSLKLKVTDNGEGIGPDELPLVFDMFYRGSEKSRGAGLGLYITKEIVNRLGGTITVQSEKGVGTTVHVEIPNSAGD